MVGPTPLFPAAVLPSPTTFLPALSRPVSLDRPPTRRHRSEAPSFGPRLEISQNRANRGFTKLRRPICGIIGILVDKNAIQNKNLCQLNGVFYILCQRGGVQCLGLIYRAFPAHSS